MIGRRWFTMWALLGTTVSVCFYLVWGWLNAHPQVLSNHAQLLLENLTLFLWPASFLLAADEYASDAGQHLLAFAVPTLANILCYLLVGALIWLGLKKHWVFFVPLALALGLWLTFWSWIMHAAG